jgi:hypothetical protein
LSFIESDENFMGRILRARATYHELTKIRNNLFSRRRLGLFNSIDAGYNSIDPRLQIIERLGQWRLQ